MPVLSPSPLKRLVRASSPPAEAPTPTIGKALFPSGLSIEPLGSGPSESRLDKGFCFLGPMDDPVFRRFD